ncbi:murein DD-endopeptidase MepM/ murein hydrolase activator NlpD [Sphingomonas zeicaulis]|uniref:peptidoglycan DD-metalloendopeptidase family protein n=1 Tax=Sphingomonas zeicaulis TaxID=1632740 RepID=UPI003D19972B
MQEPPGIFRGEGIPPPPLTYDPHGWIIGSVADDARPAGSRGIVAPLAIVAAMGAIAGAAWIAAPVAAPPQPPPPRIAAKAAPPAPAPPAIPRSQPPPSPTDISIIRGEVDRTSFYSSAVAAGLRDTLIPEFARAMAHDFDFQREVAPGDVFEAAYRTPENAPPELLYVALTTRQRSVTLYRFRAPGMAEPGWFDGNGGSATRSLLRTPVDGARVSSSFGPRVHPILGYTRLHKGTDFAVPVGTAVYASGTGVVSFAGAARGYGNYLRIRHADGVETAYAHLSGFAEGIAPGAPVQQGDLIARSGNSGLSSGPHLHYEVYVEGVPTDPITMATASGGGLAGGQRVAFRQARDRIDRLRATRGG